MPLDPDAAQMVAMAAAAPKRSFDTIQAHEYRAIVAGFENALSGAKTDISRVEDLMIDGAIPARLYANQAGSPTLVYFHGGGFVIGSIDSHDELARAIVRDSGWTVLSIGYRLAPEHPYPAAFDDCYAALLWAAGPQAAAMGIDTARLAVGGDSAGGALAAAVALMARDSGGPKLLHQLLIYPITDNDFDTPSYRENGEGYMLTLPMMRWFWHQYLSSGTEADQYAAPARAADKSGLPSATIITAEYDPLRDEGEAYGEAMRASGGDVEVRRFDGIFHGFVGMPMLARTGEARAYIAERLRALV